MRVAKLRPERTCSTEGSNISKVFCSWNDAEQWEMCAYHNT